MTTCTISVDVQVARLQRELAGAEKRSAKLAAARAALPPGSSRARVTTANARWARAAEYRDRVAAYLDKALVDGGGR
jgi:septal ring factor EnvC (AmiA/AmiB activator)